MSNFCFDISRTEMYGKYMVKIYTSYFCSIFEYEFWITENTEEFDFWRHNFLIILCYLLQNSIVAKFFCY